MTTKWDCIIVGGGAAGLSAALVLGRARRRTLLIDAGRQSNRPTHGIGGLLGHDGRSPAELYDLGRQELAAYPSVVVRDDVVVDGIAQNGHFLVELADGTREPGRRMLLAGGVDYRYPDIDGIEQRWGRSVFHCPFCHGWEVRDRPLGVLDSGATGVHRALLLTFWSDDVTLFTNGPSGLDADETERLRAAKIAVDERRVARLDGLDAELDAVVFTDGDRRQCHGLLVPVTLHQRSHLAARLGASIAASGPMALEVVATNAMFETNVPGLFAAGDTNVTMPSVANAVAAGSGAAAAIVNSLLTETYSMPKHTPPATTNPGATASATSAA